MPPSDQTAVVASARPCGGCGTDLAGELLACPKCGALVHARRLSEIATAAGSAGSTSEALGLWREALDLLPAGTRQAQIISGRIVELVGVVDAAPARKSTAGKVAAGAGLIAIFLLKFKFLIFFIATKLKFLALGLTKAGTLLSMFVSFGLYWSLWGWKFAAGFILSIYVHEIGHVAMLSRLGVKASAPMFIPGLGAVVRLKQHLPTAREDARVGLAGPIWGLGAAVFAWLGGTAFDYPMALAIAKVGAWVNLFNLTPIWQLDGSRAFHALDRNQRIIAVVAVAVALVFASGDAQGMLVLVLCFGIFRLFENQVEPAGDRRALIEYVLLIGALTLLASIPAPVR